MATYVSGEAAQPLKGWHTADAGLERTPLGYASTGRGDWGQGSQPNSTANLVWSLLTALAGIGVLACMLGEWYRQLALTTDPSGVQKLSVRGSFHLMSHQYGGWRIALPIAAGAVVVLSLLAAMGWLRGPQPRWFVISMRVLALGVIGLVITALILRTPHGVHLAPPPPQTGGALSSATPTQPTVATVQVLYHLSWAGYVTLVVSIVTFLLTLPRSTRVR
jgi:hypothetical protein